MLIVRAGGVRMYRCHRGTIGGSLEFGADREGTAALGRALREGAGSPIRVLVDLVEEDFHWETVPHVSARSRRSMLAARGARRFGADPYIYARCEGRSQEGRRDDRVRYAAVVAPERLAPWLEVVHDHEARLAGVHSLPIVSTGLLRLLPGVSGRVLLVTVSGENALRQTYFEDGVLVTSRLASLAPGSSRERARSIAAEVERFRLHIERSGRSVDELNVRVVADPRLASALRDAGAEGDSPDAVVDAQTLEARIGGRPRVSPPGRESEHEKEGADRLLARLVLCRPPRNHYAPTPALGVHRTHQAVRALYGLGLAAFVAGSAAGGCSWHRAVERAAALDDLARAAARYEAKNRGTEEEEPATVASKDLALAIEIATRLEGARTGPLAVLAPISRALEGFPDMRIDLLEWSERREARPEGDRAGSLEPAARFRAATLRGWFEPFGGHYQAAADEVQRFAEVLAGLPGLTEVEVIETPGDWSGGGRAGGGGARFAVAVGVRCPASLT